MYACCPDRCHSAREPVHAAGLDRVINLLTWEKSSRLGASWADGEAQDDLAAGRFRTFDDTDSFLADLELRVP